MRGTWLAAAARRLTREDTFEHTISPAVADLQHESPIHRRALVSAYAAVLKTIAGAFVLDTGQDFRLAFGVRALRRVWTLAGLALLLAVATRAMLQWLARPQDLTIIALMLPAFAASMLPAVLLPAAAAFRHARMSRRAVITSAALAGILTAASWLTVVPAAERAQSTHRLARGPRSELTPLSELPAPLQARVRAGIRSSREAARHAPLAFAAAVVGYALLGWAFAGAPATLIVLGTVDLAVTQSFFAARDAASGAVAPWSPAVLLLALGLVAMWVRRESDGERLTLRSG